MFHIIHIPQARRRERNKGHGGVVGSPSGHHKLKCDKDGIFFLHGNGCSKCDNCLVCPEPECKWDCSASKRVKANK